MFILFLVALGLHCCSRAFSSCGKWELLFVVVCRLLLSVTLILAPGGDWWAAVHGVAKSRTRLSEFPFTFHFHAFEKEMATHSSVLAWRIPGMGDPGGYHLWGRTESDTTEAT